MDAVTTLHLTLTYYLRWLVPYIMATTPCPAQRRDARGYVVVTCSFKMSHSLVNPEHRDVHAGRTWKGE